MENIKLRKLKAKDKKKIIKLVKAINSAEGFNLSEFLDKISKGHNLELSKEEIKIYTSNIPEESRKTFNELSEERQIEVLKGMKQEKESMKNIFETIIELIDVYEFVSDVIDEILESLSGSKKDEIGDLDIEIYYGALKDLIFSEQFKTETFAM